MSLVVGDGQRVDRLGLVDPLQIVELVENAYRDGSVPIASAEGIVRQIIGWRDFIWHLYWYFEPEYRRANELGATETLPDVGVLELTGDGQARLILPLPYRESVLNILVLTR